MVLGLRSSTCSVVYRSLSLSTFLFSPGLIGFVGKRVFLYYFEENCSLYFRYMSQEMQVRPTSPDNVSTSPDLDQFHSREISSRATVQPYCEVVITAQPSDSEATSNMAYCETSNSMV